MARCCFCWPFMGRKKKGRKLPSLNVFVLKCLVSEDPLGGQRIAGVGFWSHLQQSFHGRFRGEFLEGPILMTFDLDVSPDCLSWVLKEWFKMIFRWFLFEIEYIPLIQEMIEASLSMKLVRLAPISRSWSRTSEHTCSRAWLTFLRSKIVGGQSGTSGQKSCKKIMSW